MTIVQSMRSKLKDSMKARDAVQTNFLRYWIASDADAIKKMRTVLKEAKSGQTTFSPEEVALITDWVPPVLTTEQIVELITPIADAIKAAPKDGMAMGLAMKALAGKQVESDDVKAAVTAIRSA